MKHTKNGSTIFLRGVVLIMGLIVLALCIFALPVGIREEGIHGYGPLFWGMYATTLPFYIALYQTLKMLDLIDKNQAFSALSIGALKVIKTCAATIGGLYALGMPYIYRAANEDDAPGVIIIGLLMVLAPMAIAVFAAVLQKLLQSAIALKAENDLTV